MIIKKPYAFIIKNFKYIHATLFIVLIYEFYKFYNIFKFFNDYVKSGYYTYYENLSNHFVNFYFFLTLILIIFIGSILYLIMKIKEKKRLYYISLCLFYIGAFILLIIVFNTLTILQTETIDIRNIRILRDFLLIITFPQLFFSIFALLRSLGFDIKSFNFKKDLVDLKIETYDDEVVELLMPQETYKYGRKFRRFLRETKYFAVEYKFFFLVIVSTVGLVILLTIILNSTVYNKKYNEKDNFISSLVKYSIKESYITSVDYNGNVINEEKSYIVVLLSAINNTNKKLKIETDDLRLEVNGKEKLPILSKGNYFIDLGEAYNNQSLSPNETKDYLIIFEINNKEKSNSYIFKMYSSVDAFKGEIQSNKKVINIEPKSIDDTEIVGTYDLNSKIEMGESKLNKTSIIIKTFDIAASFEEPFNYCVQDECFSGIKSFTPNIINSFKKSIIRMECDLELDSNIYVNKKIENSSDFISYFGTIYYTFDDNAYNSKVNVLKSDYINKNKVFIEVPYNVIKSNNIDLYITIRNTRYIIRLK